MKAFVRIVLCNVLVLLLPDPGFTKDIKPSSLPAEILEHFRADKNCFNLMKDALPHKVQKEDMGKNQFVYIIPCSSGAYNIFSKVYISRDGEIEPQYFADYNTEFGWFGSDTLVNAGYDPKRKTLSSFNKSAGFGGCGSAGLWRWKNYDFQMIQFQAWDECMNDKAPEDWPYVYRHKK